MYRTRTLAADAAGVAAATTLLHAGELVAFPTETVYGLGGNALDAAAVARIFSAKGRPAEDPLIVHVAVVAQLARVTRDLPDVVELLAARFWPGPLTLIVPRSPAVPPAVSAGRDTVAVRIPQHPLAQMLLRAVAIPIAAPSANRFGHTSPTSAQHVLADLDGRIAAVIDGGATPIGIESTVLDLTAPVPTLLRPGGISLEELRKVLGEVALGRRVEQDTAQIAPGLLDRHYAPASAMWLAIGHAAATRAWLAKRAAALRAEGKRVGLLIPDDDQDLATAADLVVTLGPANDPERIASRLYAALREIDAQRPDVILARDLGEEGIARAIRDRLRRAASGNVIEIETR
ncbi:threonylcarbamoyl-AMP synthase [Candidatus Gracilibacteria bacterium]|nr:threonylcarbamoyl-AMP synthase [Candidatus Gracilibacteria bacterium]